MQSKIVRGARGVQMEEVWAAADAVLRLGERPTIERVRHQLGRGSPNTVGPMLDGWYGSLAKRLDERGVPMEQEAAGAESLLPAPIIRAAKAMWGRALQQAQEQAATDFSHERESLRVQEEALHSAKEQLAQETQRLDDRSAAYELALEAKNSQIADLARLNDDLQQQLINTQELLDTARSECVQLRRDADASRRRQESREVEHQTERVRLEERAQAHERRLNAEIDRARQESKRLALQLESDSKKAAKSLLDALDRARELDTQRGTLQVANAGLSHELQSARDGIEDLQAKLDERNNEMLAVLKELRERLPPSKTEEAALAAKVRRTRIKR
jgi:chromosome segregation ATPase